MKRIIILSSIIFACASQVSAQITESSYIVGGTSSFGLTSATEGQLTTWSFGIRPEIAKFVSEKWLVGGGLGYSVGAIHNSFLNGKNLSNNVNGFFGATRFYPLADKFYFTLEYSIGLSFTRTNSEFAGNKSTSEMGSAGIAASPGLAYFFNEKWMIFSRMGSLAYSYDHSFQSDNGFHRLGYSFQANSFGIGARYVLGTGK